MIDPTFARAHARSVPHYCQAECAVDNQHPRPPRRPDGNQNPTVRETLIKGAPMEDITAPARDEGWVPPSKTPQPRRRRFGAVAFGLVTALALGLAGGANMHRLVDLDQTATWFQQIESALQSSFTLARREIASRFESLTSGPTTVAQARERDRTATA